MRIQNERCPKAAQSSSPITLYTLVKTVALHLRLALSLQSPLFTPHAHRVLTVTAQEVPAVVKLTTTFHAAKTLSMPLCSKCFDNGVSHRLAALLALSRVAVRVAAHTPSIAVFFHKRSGRVERIAALCAEEMPRMPLSPACHNHLALNRRLAAFASWAEELVVVEMAIEAHSLVTVIDFRNALTDLDVLAVHPPMNTIDALSTLIFWLWVESDTFEAFAAMVADEALGMEAGAGGADDAACYRKSTLRTQSRSAAGCRCPVRC